MEELEKAGGGTTIRSLSKIQQNKYLQVLMKYFGSCLGWRRDEVELYFFKFYVNRDLYLVEEFDELGLPVTRIKKLLEPSTEEFADAIERFINYSIMVAGIYLPQPYEIDALKECNEVIRQNRLFI